MEISGCVTMVSVGRQMTGCWIMVNRRQRAFVPNQVGRLDVGMSVLLSGWPSTDSHGDYVMVQQWTEAPLKMPQDALGLAKALFKSAGRPRHWDEAYAVLGPVMQWLASAGWRAVAVKVAESTSHRLQLITDDVFVLYRQSLVPFHVAAFLHHLLGRMDLSLGYVRAAAAEVVLDSEARGVNGLSVDEIRAQVRIRLGCTETDLPETSDLVVSSVAREAEGRWFSPTLYHHRQRALSILRGNQSEDERASDPRIRAVLSSRYSVVTGPPGSGKTHLVRALAEYCDAQGLRIAITALSGQAASLYGDRGQTLHRLLGYGGKGFSVSQLTYDLIAVDEISMLTWPILARLLVVNRGRIVFVGDPEQIKPVGSVSVMAELLACLPAVVLPPFLSYSGADAVPVHEIHCASPAQVVTEVRARVAACVTAGVEWQVISPIHDGPLGTIAMNRMLQQLVNPDGLPVGDGFRVGDRVVVVVNQNELSPRVYNGTPAVVVGGAEESVELALLNGRRIRVKSGAVVLSYCLTIHRVQGSRYDRVFFLMPMSQVASFLETGGLLKVGRTRARQETCCLVC